MSILHTGDVVAAPRCSPTTKLVAFSLDAEFWPMVPSPAGISRQREGFLQADQGKAVARRGTGPRECGAEAAYSSAVPSCSVQVLTPG